MKIELALATDHVEVFFRNTSSIPLYLWELWNSWGWWTVSFQIRAEHDNQVSIILHDWQTEWTRNGPTIFVLAPGEKRGFPINLNDGSWKRDLTISSLKDKPLLVRVSYQTDPAETDLLNSFTNPNISRYDVVRQHYEHWALELANVFTGSVVSDWVPSSPPYDWLFAPPPSTATTVIQHQYSPEEMLQRVCNLIDQRIWEIHTDVRILGENPIIPQTILENLSTTASAGHLFHNILENTESIQQTLAEVRAYLEAKTAAPPQDKTDNSTQA